MDEDKTYSAYLTMNQLEFLTGLLEGLQGLSGVLEEDTGWMTQSILDVLSPIVELG